MERLSLQGHDIQIMPDPIRGWLARHPKPQGSLFWPVTDEQGSALDFDVDIGLLGGSAGSLKTSTILADLIQERDYSFMSAYFFRRTFPELEEAIEQAYRLFPQTGGSYNASEHTWRWASGATFRFRHLSHEKNLYENQGKAMSGIGIDESTHIPMEWIRYLVTRNRSTDPDLKIRLRLGTNPGHISCKEHMKMFFNGVCPHCEPEKAPQQGIALWGRTWHDGIPLRDKDTEIDLSIGYILSSVRDHNLLGQSYIGRLQMQRPATAKALLAGCWRLFEGLYYDIYDYNTMTVPRQEIGDEYWWQHWVGADYGYSGSAAAGVQFAIGLDNVIYVLAEYPAYEIESGPRENVRNFAQSIYEHFGKRDPNEESAKNLSSMFLGPDSWNDRGDEHTLAGQMNEVLAPHGLEFIKANNDRAGGAQLIYTMLQAGTLKIARSCRNVLQALESRLHDEKEPVKVKKVPTDPLDDVFDALRYGVYSFMESVGKPLNKRVQERMKKIMDAGGHNDMSVTTAVLKYEKVRREEEEADPDNQDSVYVGGSARRRMQQAQKRGK